MTAEEHARLGEPQLACRTCRSTLVGGYLMAAFPTAIGVAFVLLLVHFRRDDWSKDASGTALLVAVSGAAFYAGWRLVRRINRLRGVRVVAHDHGFACWDGEACRTCRWDQVADVRWKAADHYEESALYLYGVARVPGTTIREFSHTTNRVTVRRDDGVEFVFTDELERVAQMGRVIVERVYRLRGWI